MILRSVFSFSILLTLLLPQVHSQGLTRDDCTSNADCVQPRQCASSSGPCQFGTTASCRCLPPTSVLCLSDGACPAGEICVGRPGAAAFICVSESAANSDPRFERVTQPNPSGGGLTRDGCLRNSDCRAPRICVRQFAAGGPEVCVGSSPCFCFPPTFTACDSDDDCQAGEACGFGAIDICVSESVSFGDPQAFLNPTAAANPEQVQDILDGKPNDAGGSGALDPDATSETICVGERHMKDVEGIYDSAVHARVLCDMHGSCATRGHVVVFRGTSMMMGRYCHLVGCVEQLMKVNSPKWERGLRLKSWSDGLEFTAFAARYETLAEEVLLRALVRAGL